MWFECIFVDSWVGFVSCETSSFDRYENCATTGWWHITDHIRKTVLASDLINSSQFAIYDAFSVRVIQSFSKADL